MGSPDRGEHGVPVGDVELDRQKCVAVLGRQIIQRRGVARGSRDAIARREGGLGERATEAA